MLDVILEELKKMVNNRFAPMVAIYVILFFVLISRVFNLQIVQNDNLTSADDDTTVQTRELKSTRGNILDRNGVLLAYNKLSYSVTVEDTGELETSTEKNEMIYTLITILEKNGAKLANDFFIVLDSDGNLCFKETGKAELTFKRDAYSARSVDDLSQEQKEATAEDVFNFLRTGKGNKSTSMFNISSEYSVADALKIMQIRYYLMLNKYEKYVPITVATNVNNKTVAAINEFSSELPGVEVLTESYRMYNSSETLAHIMGYTGLINNDELTKLNEDNSGNYSATDQVGKTGLEEYLENYLHGQKGSETLVLNGNSEVEEVKDVVEPVAGDDVYLTIDSNLQDASYKLLEKELAGILLSVIVNSKTVSTPKSASEIRIPIYDVYFALIDNNVIDIEHFMDDEAKTFEVSVYNKYMDSRDGAMNSVIKALDKNDSKPAEDLSDSMNEYLDRVYEILTTDNIILKESIDTEDDTYKSYVNGKTSLSEFLQYAISKDWVNMDKLAADSDSFISGDELYQKILDYIKEHAKDDKQFNKYIYKQLIYDDDITGRELCIILMEQGVIEYNEDTVNKLKNGGIQAYSYLRDRIKNLDITPGQLALDPCSGSVVITDVNTGDVRAMVSYPSYDNNKLANTIDSDYYNTLLEDNSDVLINRATLTRTAPGSTYKLLTSTAGLEEGVIGPSTTIHDYVVFDKIPNPAKCHSSSGHGTINVVGAIRASCNYFFYEVGFELGSVNGSYNSNTGLATLKKYANMYGLTDKSGVEVAEYEPNVSTQDAVRSAIGQGNNAYAPVQLARYVTTVANNGTCYDLTLLDKVIDMDGKTVLDNKAKVRNTLDLKDSTWNSVHTGMREVVESLSSSFTDMGDVQVAGKTGTAQQDLNRPSHGLFVSYAPYEKPEIAVTAVINFGYSSHNAADLAGQIYKYYYNLTDTDALLDSAVSDGAADTANQD